MPPPVSPRIHFTASQEEQAQQAFNVIGLKSALMVAALSCDDQPQYDAFMTTFQPHILAEQHVMDAYFYKASGPYSGQKMEDNFVTLLANNQSVSGIGQGRTFCLNSRAEYTAVAALKTPQQLDSFVTDQRAGRAAQRGADGQGRPRRDDRHYEQACGTRHDVTCMKCIMKSHVVVKHTIARPQPRSRRRPTARSTPQPRPRARKSWQASRDGASAAAFARRRPEFPRHLRLPRRRWAAAEAEHTVSVRGIIPPR